MILDIEKAEDKGWFYVIVLKLGRKNACGNVKISQLSIFMRVLILTHPLELKWNNAIELDYGSG